MENHPPPLSLSLFRDTSTIFETVYHRSQTPLVGYFNVSFFFLLYSANSNVGGFMIQSEVFLWVSSSFIAYIFFYDLVVFFFDSSTTFISPVTGYKYLTTSVYTTDTMRQSSTEFSH